MKLGSVYIETDKFNEVVKFYEQLLQVKSEVYTENRWVEFNCESKLCIYNINYDEEKIKNNMVDNYNEAYVENFNKLKEERKNNIMILNFYVDDLKAEYNRIKKLNICEISEIMYVNITEPYYYFNVCDPEGNLIEICGNI